MTCPKCGGYGECFDTAPRPGVRSCCGGFGEHFENCELIGRINQASFWQRVDVQPDGCWLWTGATKGVTGYGAFSRNRLAHRVSYEINVGPIPVGLVIDHLCRNRLCVNPEHLEAVTFGENVRRGEGSGFDLNRAKTHCPQGHAYDEANTYVNPRGGRHCRTCTRAWQAAYKQRLRDDPRLARLDGDDRAWAAASDHMAETGAP